MGAGDYYGYIPGSASRVRQMRWDSRHFGDDTTHYSTSDGDTYQETAKPPDSLKEGSETRHMMLNSIEKIKKPMFVIAGKNDPRVPLSESQQIADALKKQGTPVWLLIAKDEGHGYRKKANQDFQFYATVDFLREYLLK